MPRAGRREQGDAQVAGGDRLIQLARHVVRGVVVVVVRLGADDGLTSGEGDQHGHRHPQPAQHRRTSTTRRSRRASAARRGHAAARRFATSTVTSALSISGSQV